MQPPRIEISRFQPRLVWRRKLAQPAPITLFAGLEAIGASLRAERGRPGMVSDQSKAPFTDGTAIGGFSALGLQMASHRYRLLAVKLMFSLPPVFGRRKSREFS